MKKIGSSARRSLSAPTSQYRPLARSRSPNVPFATRQKTEKLRQTRNLQSIASSPNLKRELVIDVAGINKILTEFVSSLTFSKAILEEVNSSVKSLKATVAHFGRFSHLKQENHTEFWNAFDAIAAKCRESVRANSQSHSIAQVADQLHRAKVGLVSVQEKSRKPTPDVVTDLFARFDEIEAEIRELDVNDSLVTVLKGLRQLQTAVPTQKCNQEIGRVMLALQSAKDAVRLKAAVDTLLVQTEDRLKGLIARKVKETGGRRRSEGGQTLRRAKSTASGRFSLGFDDRMSFTSSISRKSSKSNFSVVSATAKKVSRLSVELEKLNHEVARAEESLEKEKAKVDALQKQLDGAATGHDHERASLQKQISMKYKKTKNPEFVKTEAQILELQHRKQSLKAELARADESGRSTLLIDTQYYKERQRFLEIYRDSQDEELRRVQDIRGSLTKNVGEQMGVKLDNQRLLKESDKLRGELDKVCAAIEQLQSVREADLAIDALQKGSDISKEECATAYQKAVVEHEWLLRWKRQLQDEVSQLSTTLQEVIEQAPTDDCTEELNDVNGRMLRHLNDNGASARAEANRRAVERLKKEVQVTRAPSSALEKLRKQNKEMLKWVSGMMSQVLDLQEKCAEREQQVGATPEKKKLLKIANRLQRANFAVSRLKAENDDGDAQIRQLYERLTGRQTTAPASELYSKIKEFLHPILAPDPDDLEFESEMQREEYEQCFSEREAILNRRDFLVSWSKKA